MLGVLSGLKLRGGKFRIGGGGVAPSASCAGS